MADPEHPRRTRRPDEPPEEDPAAGFVADAVRKAVLAGVGALFLTEEGARKAGPRVEAPQGPGRFLVSQASGAKEEVLRVLAEEVRRFLESETLRQEFLEPAREHDLGDQGRDAAQGRRRRAQPLP